MSIPVGNGATGASGTGPALGYTLNLFWFNFLFMLISKNNMNIGTYHFHTLSLIYAMKLLVIFGIKIYRKLPSYLTTTTLQNGCYVNNNNNRLNGEAAAPIDELARRHDALGLSQFTTPL